MKKIYFGFLIFLFLVAGFMFSCSSNIPEEPEEGTQKEEETISSEIKEILLESNKAYLKIGSVDMKASRSINPPSDEEVLNSFVSFYLSGSGKDADNKTLSLGNINAANITELYKKQIILDAGTWTFTLTAKIGTTDFTSTVSDVVIEAGKDNSVSFNLEPKDSAKGYGGLSVKLYFDKKNVSNVVINIYKTDNDDDDSNDVVIDTKTISNSSISWDGTKQTYYVAYTRAINYSTGNTGRIASGEYRLVFDFYWDSQILNSIPYIVHIAEGVTSTHEQTIDLNEVYTITYEGISTNPSSNIATGQVKVEKYSRKSEEIILPRYSRIAYLFLGWFTASEGGERVTHIPQGSTGNKTLYAHWQPMENNTPQTLYINPDAQYHYGCSEEYGLESLEAAIETIKSNSQSSSKHDWTFKIKGSLSGLNIIESTSSGNPSYYFKTYVKSLTLEGASDLINGIPQDELNGGLSSETEDGTVLSLDTTVPIYIKNLKITGGNNSNTGTVKGGGLYIGSTTSVTLDDGVLITGNSADAGAGIYNEGTLKIKGSALIQASGTGANDIYIAEGKKLVIAGELTNTADKIAAITPEVYSEGAVVIEADSGSGVIINQSITNKFSITPEEANGGPFYWEFDEENKLHCTNPIEAHSTNITIENAANIKFAFTCDKSTITRGTSTVATITPQVTLKDGDTSRPLYYKDGKVYKGETYTADYLISEESVTWDLTLWNGDEQVTNATYVSTSENTITLNIPYPDSYVIKANATYLGYTHDAEFQITCE